MNPVYYEFVAIGADSAPVSSPFTWVYLHYNSNMEHTVMLNLTAEIVKMSAPNRREQA
jgi:hypothetical protein